MKHREYQAARRAAKQECRDRKAALKQAIPLARAQLKSAITSARAELQARIAQLRVDTTANIRALRRGATMRACQDALVAPRKSRGMLPVGKAIKGARALAKLTGQTIKISQIAPPPAAAAAPAKAKRKRKSKAEARAAKASKHELARLKKPFAVTNTNGVPNHFATEHEARRFGEQVATRLGFPVRIQELMAGGKWHQHPPAEPIRPRRPMGPDPRVAAAQSRYDREQRLFEMEERDYARRHRGSHPDDPSGDDDQGYNYDRT